MQRYVVNRLGQSLVTVLGLVTIIFLATRLLGDPTTTLLPAEVNFSKEDLARFRAQLGLEKPLYAQYGSYLKDMATGDWGISYRQGRPVREMIFDFLPNTVILAFSTIAFAAIVGLTVGILSALRPGGRVDQLGKLVALLGQSMPSFWIGLLLILLFAVVLGILPAGGKAGFKSLILPTVTLGWLSVAAIARLSRSSMLSVLDAEHIKMARIMGIGERSVILKHALKNASIPVLTLMSLQLGTLLGGAVIVETIFAWPGIGRLAYQSILLKDFPAIQGVVFVAGVKFVVINLFVDLLYGYLDPRIRYS